MLGLDVPYTKFGTTAGTGHPTASNDGTCGDSFALQQMLKDLGYYAGVIDGAIGSGTMTALRKLSEATGIPYTPGTFPKGPTCQGVMDAWVAKMSGPTTARVPGTTTFKAVDKKTIVSLLKVMSPTQPTSAPGGGMEPDTNAGWWSSQSTTTKAAIVGGGVLLLGGLAYISMKPSAPAATPNRSKKRASALRHAAAAAADSHFVGLLQASTLNARDLRWFATKAKRTATRAAARAELHRRGLQVSK